MLTAMSEVLKRARSAWPCENQLGNFRNPLWFTGSPGTDPIPSSCTRVRTSAGHRQKTKGGGRRAAGVPWKSQERPLWQQKDQLLCTLFSVGFSPCLLETALASSFVYRRWRWVTGPGSIAGCTAPAAARSRGINDFLLSGGAARTCGQGI